ncbi:uncharacterized protein LOC100855345 isoform X2 [Vitis vinifera]|uniref:uncharacterized protein LOC100855345 isoform X2 n=1 Tax=Vitis vinifera TaxID=29760 RepID=UPI000540001A|nr:uncharacterized protein LOC100855345 isoform X2 [Vitis vinifera]|eukprot:XP_010655661.1 PREDICTED: uncharacterized protein LOC100855345 isoform X2 [Vitis vinifera]
MESVIGLHFSTLPSPSVRMPSGFHAARATKPHLRLSHSSLSLPKDPRSLSLGHNSSLSLPQSSGGRPLDHIIGPISCMVDGSLPPIHNRDHRGAANVPWASRFLRNVGWGNRSNHKAKAGSDGGSLQSDNAKQIIDTVNELNSSQKYNLALELLKAYEPCVSDEQSLSYFRLHMIKTLCYQEKYQEASNYWIQLYDMENYRQILHQLSSKMKPFILYELSRDKNAIDKFVEFDKKGDQSMPPNEPDLMN